MSAHLLETRLRRFLGHLIERRLLNAGPVVIRYRAAGRPNGFDPNDEASYAPAAEKAVTVTALIHFVAARTVERQYAEIRSGDALLTFESELRDAETDEMVLNEDDAPLTLEALTKARFEINGELYVQASVGKELARYWSSTLGGYPLAQTIAVRKSN